MLKKILLFIALFSAVTALQAMDLNGDGQLHVYAIPGLGGTQIDPDYIREILGTGNIALTQVKTPFFFADLGQSRCIRYLRSQCRSNPNEQVVVYAASQGTATALQYLIEDQGRQIKALILEAPLVSGNRAIQQTVGSALGMIGLPRLRNSTAAYYLLPYLTKIAFPFYSPSGKQVIKSLEKLPRHVPIIIIHATGDLHIPYDDACALYYGLKNKCGHDNVYFIRKNHGAHIYVLDEIYDEQDDRCGLRAILRQHGLLHGVHIPNHFVAEDYQPMPHGAYKDLYDKLVAREHNHVRLGYGAKAATGIAAIAATNYLVKKYSGQSLWEQMSQKMATVRS